MLNPAILIGLVIIFVCGGFVLLNAEKTDETRPEDDSQIVLPEIVSMDDYLLHKKERRNSTLLFLTLAILAILAYAYSK